MSDTICPTCGRLVEGTVGSPCPHDGAPLISTRAVSAAVPRLGHLIADRYCIVDLLGKGAMGTVFDAVDTHTGDRVALKMLRGTRAEDPRARRRFTREARMAAALRSPFSVRVLDFGVSDDEQLFMVMERLEGWSLYHHLRVGKPLDTRLAIGLTLDTLTALDEIHALGLVHRDVKPSNIMLVDVVPPRLQARLLDFGVAKVIESVAMTPETITMTGRVVGTPQYMAPEQIRQGGVGAATDIYALGCVLYEMLVGHSPFGQLISRLDQVTAHIESPVPPLPPTVPYPLARLILRCLAKSPTARPADAAELSSALYAIRSGLDIAPLPVQRSIGPAAATMGDTTAGDETAGDLIES